MRASSTHCDHLDMTLLQPPLNAIEVSGIEVVSAVRLRRDIVVHDALLERARVISFLPGVRHGGQVC